LGPAHRAEPVVKPDGKIAVAVLQIRTAFCAPLMKTGAMTDCRNRKRRKEHVKQCMPPRRKDGSPKVNYDIYFHNKLI